MIYYSSAFKPERVTMPDIDIDFEDTEEKSDSVRKQKYGQYHVSGIVTFGHLLASERDVGRIIGFDENVK